MTIYTQELIYYYVISYSYIRHRIYLIRVTLKIWFVRIASTFSNIINDDIIRFKDKNSKCVAK